MSNPLFCFEKLCLQFVIVVLPDHTHLLFLCNLKFCSRLIGGRERGRERDEGLTEVLLLFS